MGLVAFEGHTPCMPFCSLNQDDVATLFPATPTTLQPMTAAPWDTAALIAASIRRMPGRLGPGLFEASLYNKFLLLALVGLTPGARHCAGRTSAPSVRDSPVCAMTCPCRATARLDAPKHLPGPHSGSPTLAATPRLLQLGWVSVRQYNGSTLRPGQTVSTWVTSQALSAASGVRIVPTWAPAADPVFVGFRTAAGGGDYNKKLNVYTGAPGGSHVSAGMEALAPSALAA